MFEIRKIFAGWMDAKFSESGNLFSFSYIQDVKADLDDLFLLNPNEEKACDFDLEGEDIRVQTKRDDDIITISVSDANTGKPFGTYKHNYFNYVKEYVAQFRERQAVYITEFEYHDKDGYIWETNNWKRLEEIADGERL